MKYFFIFLLRNNNDIDKQLDSRERAVSELVKFTYTRLSSLLGI